MGSTKLGSMVAVENQPSTLRRRKDKNIYKVVTAKNISLVKEKAAVEEKDGWSIVRKNRKSYRMSREKPLDEQLEDELWCLVAQMGFIELSDGRNFYIQDLKSSEQRQIDVYAKDDEVALIIECTQCQKPKRKSMVPLIQKMKSFKSGIYKSITAHYGRDAQIKPRMAIATRNVLWSDADLEKCKSEGISVLTDSEIDYYNLLTKHLRTASRYQFLAHIFSGVEIRGLSKQVPATKGTMGGTTFYNFLIRPDDLLKISYVGHKASRETDSIETYQRMLKPTRLKNIAKYINEGGKFPTNIVINLKTKSARKKLEFDQKDTIGDSAFGTLKLPNRYASAWVIDGQHRLYGYAYRDMFDAKKDDKSLLPVLAFENMSAEDEMKMFIDVNCEQVKVQRSLLVELYADLHWNSPDPRERLLALQSRIVAKLNSDKLSPVYERVIVTGKKKTHDRCLTQTSLAEGLNVSKLLGTIIKGKYVPGPLADKNGNNLQKSLRKSSKVIEHALNQFRLEMPEHWQLGDRPGGYLCTNNAIRAVFLVLKDICDHVSIKQGSDLSLWEADEINEEIEKYLKPVVAFFKRADSEQIFAFRRQQALAGVKKQSQGMCVYINKSILEFNPLGLQEYVATLDQEGTEEATLLINSIQKMLFSYMTKALKEKFGEAHDAWWVEGIPIPIQQSCNKEWTFDKQANPRESYLLLSQYRDIAFLNWDEFGQHFALGEKDIANKKKCTSWMNELNLIRRVTHHPEKGILEKDQVAFVKKVSEKVKKFFPALED